MKNCPNCGKELNDEMEFCPSCGTCVNDESNEVLDSEYEEDESPWYETDIFSVALSPLIKSFDNGRFFLITAKVIIDVIVSGFLLLQPYSAYQMLNNHILAGCPTSTKTIVLINTIVWLVIAIFSFGYWMKRKRRLESLFNPKDEFVVIPLGSYMFQWFGEWLALVSSIGGLFAIIISLIHVKISSSIMINIIPYGWIGGVIAIIAGIIIVFIFRLISEKIRALVAIANNTRRLQDNDVVVVSEEEEGANEMYYNIIYFICILLTVIFVLAAMFTA